MEQETKVLPVALTKEQRLRLGVMAAERCVAMTELVRWWIDEKWSGRTSGPSKTPPVERKQGSVESGYVDLNKVLPVESNLDVKAAVRKFGTPVEDEVTMRRCHKCGDVFNPEKLTMLRIAGGKLKPFCGDCVDNMKNGQ